MLERARAEADRRTDDAASSDAAADIPSPDAGADNPSAARDLALVERAVGDALDRLPEYGMAGDALSLADFPHGFLPLLIVLGDRREHPPKQQGDQLALGGAMIDVMVLLELGIDPALARAGQVRIVSDKDFAELDDRTLRDFYGSHNLLVIGSPAANFASRRLNRHAIFRFDEAEQLRRWREHQPALARFVRARAVPPAERATREALLHAFRRLTYGLPRAVHATLARLDRDPARRGGATPDAPAATQLGPDFDATYPAAAAAAYGVSAGDADALQGFGRAILGGLTADNWVQELRGRTLIDPFKAQPLTHGGPGTPYDWGVLTLARHPFSDDPHRVAILAAGIHGPGTAQAVRLLANPANFAGLPAGGLLQVNTDQDRPWHDLLWEAPWRWLTDPYTYVDAERALLVQSGRATASRDAGTTPRDADPGHLARFCADLARWHAGPGDRDTEDGSRDPRADGTW